MLPFKRLHRDLEKLRPNIRKEMFELVRGKNDARGIAKKVKVVKRILGKLEK